MNRACQAPSLRGRVADLIASVCDLSTRNSIRFTSYEPGSMSGTNLARVGAILARHELVVVEKTRSGDVLERAR